MGGHPFLRLDAIRHRWVSVRVACAQSPRELANGAAAIAGMIYVVGEVNQPGSFVLPNNGKLTVLQALALGQGLTRVAAKDRGMIVRTDPNGNRKEIPVDLKKIMEGKSPEIALEARDVLFVPNSRAKSIGIGTVDALVRVLSFRP